MSDVPSMNLIVDDPRQIVQVYDFNQTDWDANITPIPDGYTLQFIPQLEDSVWNALNLGREVYYHPTTVYYTSPTRDGYITAASTIYVQYFLPKDPVAAQAAQVKLATS